ncbi:retinol dehydrogenase 7-like [Pelodytes ibericus]
MWLPLLIVGLALIFLYRWHRQSQILSNLTDKYVFITGCDTGFGNLLAKQLDRRGMRVLAACLTDKGAENLKKEASSRLQTVILDVTDSTNVASVTKWVTSVVGESGLWGLVNNAGIVYVFAPNEWQKKEDFTKVLNVNLLGLIDVTLNLLPLIRKAQGRIVNVSSAVGRLSILGGAYCISKCGVESFSDTLRRDMRPFGVKVAIIEPGAFKTLATCFEQHRTNSIHLWNNMTTEAKESYGEQFFQQYTKDLELFVNKVNPKLYEVTNCMEHALTAVFPWTRYSPGWDSKLFYLPLSYLPTIVSDYILCRHAPKPATRVM